MPKVASIQRYTILGHKKEVACDVLAKVLEVQYGMNVNVKVEQIRG